MKLKPILLLTGVCAAGIASAQGIFVQPTSYEIAVKPGGSYNLPLILRSNQAGQSNNVSVSIERLIQGPAGFDAVPVGQGTTGLSPSNSCDSWIAQPTQSTFSLDPLGQSSMNLRLLVPAGAQGFYSCAIVVTAQRPQGGPGIHLVLRFVIPILLQVGTSVSHKAGSILSAGAGFIGGGSKAPSGTQVICLVKNEGNAVARFSGKADLFQVADGRKRRVIAAQFDERRVIPNATLSLVALSPNRIPSGKYRIEAEVVMEGQKLKNWAADIEVKGDPSVKVATEDVDLGIRPEVVEFDAIAGAFRGLPFTVQNTGPGPIVVDAYASTPSVLLGTIGASGTGEARSLAPWCSQPLTGIVIQKGESRTLRLPALIPDGDLTFPRYFGEIHIVAKTDSGVSVGNATILAIGKNSRVAEAPAVTSSGEIVLSTGTSHLFGFTSSFTNSGNVDIQPVVEARITDTGRVGTVLPLDTAALPPHVLPFQTIRPSGQIDANLLKDGVYLIEITVKAGSIRESKTLGIRVSTVNKVKKLTVAVTGKPAESRK